MSHRKHRVALAAACLAANVLHAQVPQRTDTDTLWCDATLRHALAHGSIEGRFRSFAMGTINRGALPDHHAGAFGGALGYRSARWHGLRFSLVGGYTFPVFASSMWRTDDPALQPARYELGLFDVTGHRQNEYLYLHEFNIDYSTRNRRWQFTLGKQHLDGPFLNAQDSRMHPTLFDGLTINRTGSKGTHYSVAWMHHVAPRGTMHWYGSAQSIGAYPGQGRDEFGRPSAYGGHLRSAGIFSVLIDRPLGARLTLQAHDLFVANVFNTAYLQLSYRPLPGWSAHFRVLRQDAVGQGGNPVDSLAYLPPGGESNTISARLERVKGAWTVRLNGTRITTHGRFLMPREWGREPLYTYLDRERNEGLGDVWAVSINTEHRNTRIKGLSTRVDAGLYSLPSVGAVRLNKYDMLPYGHCVLDLRYAFRGHFTGLQLRVLYVYKWPLHRSTGHTVAQVYNRVDMHHASLILDYRF